MVDSHREPVASDVGEAGLEAESIPEPDREPEPDRVPELLRLGDRLMLLEMVGLLVKVWPPPGPTHRKNRKKMKRIAKLGGKGGETLQRFLQRRATAIAHALECLRK